MTVKAIETQWKGYRFRSRLEARWAVFFDAVGVDWTYEPEGFEGDNGRRYLPDFCLKWEGYTYWAEVKGDKNWLRESKATINTLPIPDMGLIILGDIPFCSFGLTFVPVLGGRDDEGLTRMLWLCLCDGHQAPIRLKQIATYHFGMEFIRDVTEADDADLCFQPKIVQTPRGYLGVIDALQKARAARFEHGQVPA